MIHTENTTIQEKELLIEFLAILKESNACTERHVNIISTYYLSGLQEVKEAFTKENLLDFVFQVLSLIDVNSRGDARLNLLLNIQNN